MIAEGREDAFVPGRMVAAGREPSGLAGPKACAAMAAEPDGSRRSATRAGEPDGSRRASASPVYHWHLYIRTLAKHRLDVFKDQVQAGDQDQDDGGGEQDAETE